MKRVKIILMCTAVALAIGTAFATRPCQSCIYSDQFYQTSNGYVPAGQFGVDYYCFQYGTNVCTYYRPFPIAQPNNYVPCKMGVYTPIP